MGALQQKDQVSLFWPRFKADLTALPQPCKAKMGCQLVAGALQQKDQVPLFWPRFTACVDSRRMLGWLNRSAGEPDSPMRARISWALSDACDALTRPRSVVLMRGMKLSAVVMISLEFSGDDDSSACPGTQHHHLACVLQKLKFPLRAQVTTTGP